MLPTHANVKKQDLQANISGGVIIHTQFGSLIKLREGLEKLFSDSFIYFQISSEPLYLVHWNDLSENKKRKLGGNGKIGKRR